MRRGYRTDDAGTIPAAMIVAFDFAVSTSAVLQVILAALVIILILAHSGRDAGFGGIGFTPASQGGQHVVERNLTRITVVVAILFAINTVVLYRLLA
jgi:protein translocase SecG subunit